MKNFKFSHLFLGILLLFTLFVSAQYFQAHAENPDSNKEVILNIDGIGCITCEWTIEEKLKGLAGVEEADVSSKKVTWWNPFSAREGKASITYDANSVTVEQLIETIEKSSDAVYSYTASVLSQPTNK